MKVLDAWSKCKSALPKIFLWEGRMLWPTLYITARVLYWYEPWHGVPITEFDRVMGNATLSDVLISGRTGQAMLTLLVFIPLLLLASWALVSFCIGPGKAYENRKEFSGWLSAFSGVGLCAMALDYAKQFGTNDDIWMTEAQAVPLAVVLCTLLWCVCRRLMAEDKAGLSADNVKQNMLCGLMLGFPVQMLAHFGTYTAVICGVCVIIATISSVILSQFKTSVIENRARAYAGIPLLLMLPAMLLYLEIGSILNQYGVYVGRSQRPLTVVALCCIFVSGIIGRIAHYRLKKQGEALIGIADPAKVLKSTYDWRKCWYPIVIVSIALLAGHPGLQEYVGSDFFERANKAVSINGFLSFGQIPTVETHAAHMGLDYYGGILWGLINGDAYSASFTSYTGIYLALTMLVFFYLLRRMVDADYALVATLILPVMETSHSAGDWYAHIAYLPVLVLVWAIEKPCFRRYALFWASAAFSVLYRGDIGLALGVACVLVLLIHTVMQKKAAAYKLYFGSFGAVGGGMAAVLVVICLIKGINPLSRLWEFIQVTAMSNQDWAYTSLGTTGNPGFAWTFLITPVALVGMTYVILARLWRKQVTMRSDHWLYLAFTIGYFINFPRTLVRHSLLEMIPVYCLAMGMWALAMGVWLLWKDRAPERRPGGVVLPAMLMLSLLITAVMFNGQFLSSNNLFAKAHDNFEDGDIIYPQLVRTNGETYRVKEVTWRVRRVVIPAAMETTAQELEEALSELLDEDDTWLDFTNQSTLYAMLNRRSPVFVNQSPGLLSGDFSQECFIEQIESQREDVPVALLPNSNMLLGYSLDGVLNSLRYYRVAEYIYNNYVPYGTAAGFAIWVRPERLEEMQAASDANEADEETGRMVLSADGLRAANCTVTESDGTLLINAEGEDPVVESFHKLLAANGIKGGKITLNISYTSDTAGDLQLFWADSGRNFEEENSIRVPINATDTEKSVQLVVDWKTTQRLRLDTPDYSNVVITKIVTDASIAVSSEYGYGTFAETHNYQMGAIARLWGEQDEKRAWENTSLAELGQNKQGVYVIRDELTGGENGRYIRVRINTVMDGSNATLSLVKTTDTSTSVLSTFNFTLEEGHHTYLFRVSCDSYWYSGEVNGVTISAPGVYSVAVLEGD